MTLPDDPRSKAIAAYNAAADRYDDPANSFWERFGRRTVERLDLARGARVLDVCCGSGASALPAAEAVGPDGFVLGVDLAEGLLELARRKARARGLSNVRPELERSFNPWDRISEPASLLALLREAGVERAEAVAEAGEHPVPTPEAWWSAVLGTGYRGTVERLSAADRERVRRANLDFMRLNGHVAVEANVVYASAAKS